MTTALEKPKQQASHWHDLQTFYFQVRQTTEFLCHPLEIEDFVVQPVEDVSPPKWHLAHTTWFFETNVLQRLLPRFKPFRDQYNYMFNSYYESFGDRVSRPNRGVLSRPTVQEIFDYRHAIDEQMERFMKDAAERNDQEALHLIEIGLHHEQQHQELLITDIKYIFSVNPLLPVYNKNKPRLEPSEKRLKTNENDGFVRILGGLQSVGHQEDSFSYDNERPHHQIYLGPYQISQDLVTNGDYANFIKDGGYKDFRLWMSDGWERVQQHKWGHPLYWQKKDNEWFMMTLNGLKPLNPREPVSHVSFYEADAYARWAQKRLPTELEWENAARHTASEEGSFLEDHLYHPQPARPAMGEKPSLRQILGDVWEWTNSAYLPYPGFDPEPGPLAEYNGKFMSNQMVLKGGSCATPKNHVRLTYRNFYQPDKRWQFTGFRLASDA